MQRGPFATSRGGDEPGSQRIGCDGKFIRSRSWKKEIYSRKANAPPLKESFKVSKSWMEAGKSLGRATPKPKNPPPQTPFFQKVGNLGGGGRGTEKAFGVRKRRRFTQGSSKGKKEKSICFPRLSLSHQGEKRDSQRSLEENLCR